MSPEARRRIGQALIIVPTLTVSVVLGRMHVPVLLRLAASLAVGLVAILFVGLWERSSRE